MGKKKQEPPKLFSQKVRNPQIKTTVKKKKSFMGYLIDLIS